MNKNEILYNQLYERTKDFGRNQFIKEIMRLEREKQNEKKLIKYLEDKIKLEKIKQKFLYENENSKLVEKATVNSSIRSYREILERIKSGKYDE